VVDTVGGDPLPMFAPRSREELVAACGVHGHRPFNLRTIRREMREEHGLT
jgi:hypothetical protein